MCRSEVEREAVLAQLVLMTDEIRLNRGWHRPVEPDAPLLSAGFDSIMLITLLRRVEEEFGVSWGGGVPASAFRSLGSITDVVVEALNERGDTAADVTPGGGTPAG